jgi:hypothetical protein
MAQAGYTKREPVEFDIRGEQPRLIFELLEAHIEDLGIAYSDLPDLLMLNDHEFQSIYGTNPTLNNVTRFPSRVAH